MVISRLLRATMVAGDSTPDKGPHPSPSGRSVRADAAGNTAAVSTPTGTPSREPH
jgi:hypothetical protein